MFNPMCELHTIFLVGCITGIMFIQFAADQNFRRTKLKVLCRLNIVIIEEGIEMNMSLPQVYSYMGNHSKQPLAR